ncbi:hypothetical protein GLYMA_03G087500v4 [Glycine max]|uniref:TIR domain-containing protein n=1 Tax=Glycine max TaxID=3847 RepID=K7KDV6_SOYBN|nr:hypothetical protein GYH30_006664 [Glycine max]KRH66167.1 hypothetical protein GLYMA_03G087500v4 [Glycine max]
MELESSSSSFSKPKSQWTYDVFINFRGEDTRRSFVCHLNCALSKAGVKTFLDEENLHKGMKLDELMTAIEGSQIAIVVFSKSYTESTWCLRELEKVIECNETYGQSVLPVFYNIDPSVVRHRDEKHDFGKVLKSTAEKNYSGEHLENALSRWSRALSEASKFSGWDASKFRNDAELVEKIVEDVLTKIEYDVLSITKFPVGLKSRVQKVIGFIENQSTRACIIVIWGMGGSGKTTAAKAIYNEINCRFGHKSFIEDIREVCSQTESKGLVSLQEKLLSDILKTNHQIQNVGMGTIMIEKRLSGKRVLIVLDDVNEIGQVEGLCGNCEWFGPGTVIIITTRDVGLLNTLKVDCVYEMEQMNENESLELFSWHAFDEAKPRKDFNELARSVVVYCGGLPLALRVLGSYLNNRRKNLWESVLSKLEMIPNGEVQKKLRISFDGLSDYMEKDIFLDVCCFFIGKDRAYVTDVLNGRKLHAKTVITDLIGRSLIRVEKNNKLGMHPLLQEMGREIIREKLWKEPGKRSRLWFHEDVLDVLTKNTGTEAIEGLALKSHLTSRACFKTCAFEKMKNLRLLQLDHAQLAGNYCYLSKQLKWICWQGFRSKYIPNNLYLEDVIAFDLKHSHLQLLWEEPQVLQWLKIFNVRLLWKNPKVLWNLKILNLSHSKDLTETPDFSTLPSLEKLILKDCPSLCKDNDLGDLAPMLSNLSNLRSVMVQCHTKFQLSEQLETILSDVYGVNYTKIEMTSQISKYSSKYYLNGIGNCEVLDTLSNSISEGMATSESCDVFLPGDNYPDWLAYMDEGYSVYFTVPDYCGMKGMTLCVVYISTPEIMATESLVSVLIVNYTKCTIQIHKRDTVISFNDVDWQGIISHLGPGDKVEIFVIFGNGLVIKKTSVYLMCDESINRETEPSLEPKKEIKNYAFVIFVNKILIVVAFGLFLFLFIYRSVVFPRREEL